MKIAVGFAGPDLQQITREFGLVANDDQMAIVYDAE